MITQGTTPRRITDLIGSLCDLTSGSGDKGTPVVFVQGYFDNLADEQSILYSFLLPKKIYMIYLKQEGGYMNKKKKGFTLIELLAVIVILAVIALIATPAVTHIIESSRKIVLKNMLKL